VGRTSSASAGAGTAAENAIAAVAAPESARTGAVCGARFIMTGAARSARTCDDGANAACENATTDGVRARAKQSV